MQMFVFYIQNSSKKEAKNKEIEQKIAKAQFKLTAALRCTDYTFLCLDLTDLPWPAEACRGHCQTGYWL